MVKRKERCVNLIHPYLTYLGDKVGLLCSNDSVERMTVYFSN